MRLLNEYKTKALGINEPIQELSKPQIIYLLKCFFQTIRKTNNELYEPNSLMTMYFTLKRHILTQIQFDSNELKQVSNHFA